MQPLNDDNLDRLSREAADQFELDPGAFGWERLEKRLTQELPEEKDRRRFLFWLFFIVFVTGGGLLMMLGNGRQKPVGSKQLAVSENKTQDTRVKEEGSRKYEAGSTKAPAKAIPQQPSTSARQPVGSKQLPVDESKAQGTGDKAQEKTEYEAGSTKPKNQLAVGSGQLAVKDKEYIGKARVADEKTNNQPGGLVKKPTAVAIDGETKKPIQKPAIDNNRPLVHNQDPATSDKQPAPGTQKPVTPDIQQPTTEPATKTVTPDPVITAAEPVANDKQPVPGNQPPAAKQPIPRTKQPIPLEIGLVFGPDWTYVKYWQSYKTGYNVGLQIGYRFNNRWSANTGLFYTKKNYAANGKDFTAPKRSYISYQDLRYLKGDCSMFEIPINLRYDVVANKKNRIFASAGLTSYIMKDQDYEYSFYNQAGVFRTVPWGTDSTFNHFFSVVNISAGYEWSLNKQFSLQAEPYLKLPLKGLGYGTMRMQSMGLNLSIKYRPFFRK